MKLSGIGNVRIQITATPDAQMWFNQGLNLFHDFWDYESLRAFEQGVRVDPQCAMCYWGLYQTATTSHGNAPYFAIRLWLKLQASRATRARRNASTLRRVLHMRRH